MKTKLFTILLTAATFLLTPLFGQEKSAPVLNWSVDYEASVQRAKAEKKPLLIYFTGSDWCPYCKYMDRDVLDKPEFIDFANKNYVMVLCDFPRAKEIPENVAAANKRLAQKFSIRGFPTMIIMNPQNMKVGAAGYENGITPKSFIEAVSKIFEGLSKSEK